MPKILANIRALKKTIRNVSNYDPYGGQSDLDGIQDSIAKGAALLDVIASTLSSSLPQANSGADLADILETIPQEDESVIEAAKEIEGLLDVRSYHGFDDERDLDQAQGTLSDEVSTWTKELLEWIARLEMAMKSLWDHA